MNHTPTLLSREVSVIQIPSGETVTLPAGVEAYVTQSLGGSYTVAVQGALFRISAIDADALGIESEKGEGEVSRLSTPETDSEGDIEASVWQQLKTVYDPEIPVNIVDLGLVYDCRVMEEDAATHVLVKMTLTAPGCGMGPTIAADARNKILCVEGIDDAQVDLVWDPPWNQDMISEDGRMKLGMM